MIDQFAKGYLLDDLRWARAAMLGKLDGLSEYDVRRPLTVTGTNLLGLIKHLTLSEARYFGDVFGRPLPESLPRWHDAAGDQDWMWAAEHETRAEVIGRYRRACEHADVTISTLPIDAAGHVPWWPRPDVKLFNVMIHVLTETSRHAGHADILREQLDGSVGEGAPLHGRDAAHWESYRARIEQAAKAAASNGQGQALPANVARRATAEPEVTADKPGKSGGLGGSGVKVSRLVPVRLRVAAGLLCATSFAAVVSPALGAPAHFSPCGFRPVIAPAARTVVGAAAVLRDPRGARRRCPR